MADNTNYDALLLLCNELAYLQIEFEALSTSAYATADDVNAVCEKMADIKLRLRQIADLASDHGLLKPPLFLIHGNKVPPPRIYWAREEGK